MSEPSTEPAPLQGIRILDLTRLLPGAYTTQMLADLGAEVIKIEQPKTGDYWRWMQPRVVKHGAQFLDLNRGKASVELDLKDTNGRARLLSLAATSDVLIESYRPDVMERLGLGNSVLRTANPRLIICSMSGFGSTGPMAMVAAHDLNYQGLAGTLGYLDGGRGFGKPPGLPLGDLAGGAQNAIAGILAALYEREKSGIARTVEISIFDGLLSLSSFMASAWNTPDGHRLPDTPFDAPYDKPFYTIYETADMRHLVVGAYEPKFWEALCRALGLEQWIDRQWVEGEDEATLREALANAFKSESLAHWQSLFNRVEACVTPVWSLREALDSEQVKARNSLITVHDPFEGDLTHLANPIRFDGKSIGSRKPAPPLGADNERL